MTSPRNNSTFIRNLYDRLDQRSGATASHERPCKVSESSRATRTLRSSCPSQQPMAELEQKIIGIPRDADVDVVVMLKVELHIVSCSDRRNGWNVTMLSLRTVYRETLQYYEELTSVCVLQRRIMKFSEVVLLNDKCMRPLLNLKSGSITNCYQRAYCSYRYT